MKKAVLLLAFLSLGQIASTKASYGQAESPEPVSTPVEQSSTSTSTIDTSPTAPAPPPTQLLPPELPARPPIPAPPAVTLLTPLNGGQIKDPMSWRTKAYKLRLEGSDAKGGIVKASRTFSAGFEDTLAALTAVLATQGITIDSIFDSAGQILAHPGDGSMDKRHIIFSIKPLSKTSTQVRVGTDTEGRSTNDKRLDDLLLRMDTAINQKGIL